MNRKKFQSFRLFAAALAALLFAVLGGTESAQAQRVSANATIDNGPNLPAALPDAGPAPAGVMREALPAALPNPACDQSCQKSVSAASRQVTQAQAGLGAGSGGNATSFSRSTTVAKSGCRQDPFARLAERRANRLAERANAAQQRLAASSATTVTRQRTVTRSSAGGVNRSAAAFGGGGVGGAHVEAHATTN